MTDSIKMTCFLTKNGWEMSAESAGSDKVWREGFATANPFTA